MKRLSILLFIILIMLGVFLRFFDLEADPPANLSNSAGAYFDGFDNSHAARSSALFGDLRPDGWDPVLYSPPFVYLQLVWFKVFAPSIWSINAFSAFFSALSFLLAVSIFRTKGWTTLCSAALLFGMSFLWLHLGRVAMFENIMVFFMVCSACCIGWKKISPVRAAGAGFFAILAYASKATAVFFLPAVLLSVLLACFQCYKTTRSIPEALKIFVAFLGGVLLSGVPWLLLFRIPDHAQISYYGKRWMALAFPQSIEEAFNNVCRLLSFQYTLPFDVLLVVALIIAVGVVLVALFKPSKVQPLALLLSLWLGAGFLLMGIVSYSPVRYIIPLFPAAIGLIVFAFSENILLPKGIKRFKTFLMVLICAHFIYGNGSATLDWLRERTYTIRNFNQVVNQLPQGSVISGISIVFAVADTNHKALRIDPRPKSWYNTDRPFKRFGITHLIVTEYGGNRRETFYRYKRAAQRAKLIGKHEVCGYDFQLYELEPQLQKTKESRNIPEN